MVQNKGAVEHKSEEHQEWGQRNGQGLNTVHVPPSYLGRLEMPQESSEENSKDKTGFLTEKVDKCLSALS